MCSKLKGWRIDSVTVEKSVKHKPVCQLPPMWQKAASFDHNPAWNNVESDKSRKWNYSHFSFYRRLEGSVCWVPYTKSLHLQESFLSMSQPKQPETSSFCFNIDSQLIIKVNTLVEILISNHQNWPSSSSI